MSEGAGAASGTVGAVAASGTAGAVASGTAGAVVASRPAQTVQFFAQLMKKKCGVAADLADSFSKKTSCWQLTSGEKQT
jgi:hypothetical protein